MKPVLSRRHGKWEPPALLDRAVVHDVPVLGLCFGGQVLATVLGGVVLLRASAVRRQAAAKAAFRLFDGFLAQTHHDMESAGAAGGGRDRS